MHINKAVVHDERKAKPMKLSVNPKYEPVAGPSWMKDDNSLSAAHSTDALL
jgi:hypothetical protein